MRSEYGLDLREVVAYRSMYALDFADLVAWLPAGCALWKSIGGPAALAEDVSMLRTVDYSVRVLDYHAGRHGKGKRPVEPKPTPYAHERREKEQRAARKAKARLRVRGSIPRGRPARGGDS